MGNIHSAGKMASTEVQKMQLEETARFQIEEMGRLNEVFNESGLGVWQWGGWIPDIYTGEVLREHEDLDFLYLDEGVINTEGLKQMLEKEGWKTEYEKGTLVAHKGRIEAGFIAIKRVGDGVIWDPLDREGTIEFPAAWLPEEEVDFRGIKTRVADIRLSYAMKVLPYRINPHLSKRSKDEEDIKAIEDILIQLAETNPEYEPKKVLEQIRADPSVFGVN